MTIYANNTQRYSLDTEELTTLNRAARIIEEMNANNFSMPVDTPSFYSLILALDTIIDNDDTELEMAETTNTFELIDD